MSTVAFLKVGDAQVQRKMKEALAKLDTALPGLDARILIRTSRGGCEERIRFGRHVSPGLVLERLEAGTAGDGQQLDVEFDFTLHNEAEGANSTSCRAHQIIANAKSSVVEVKRDENGTLTSSVTTTTVYIDRVGSGSSQTNDALNVTRTHTVKTERQHDLGFDSTTSETSRTSYLTSPEELDEVLAAFLGLALLDLTA